MMRGVWMLILSLGLLTACGDNEQVDFGGDELGLDIRVVVSEDGAVQMGLTRDWLYFALSDSARTAARTEMEEDMGDGFFAGIMQNLLGRALEFRAKYPVREVQEIGWSDGRMHVRFTDPDRRLDDNLQLGEGESVTEAFSEDAVRGLAEAFDSLKARP